MFEAKSKRRITLVQRLQLLSLAAIGMFCVGAFWLVRGVFPGGDGVVARATASDGTELCMTQKYNDSIAEPYTVSFYYRRPGRPWGWYYFEHEDLRWVAGRIRLAEQGTLARIYNGVTEVARFDIPHERFTIARWNRTTSPAQLWMHSAWKPENLVPFATGNTEPTTVSVEDPRIPHQ